jgi:hypothetical protein
MLSRLLPVVVTVLLVSIASAQQDLDRVLHFTSTDNPQNLKEIATLIRLTADIQQVAVDTGERTLTLRGTGAQMALAEWLFTELDKPASGQALQSQNWAKHEYRVSDTADDLVRIFYVPGPQGIAAFQEVATTVRSIADIRRMFTYNALKAIAVRGTAEQAKLAEFLFAELDQPDSVAGAQRRSASAEYRMAEPRENLVRVFYLPSTKTVQDFQEVAQLVRTITDARRLFTYNAPKAMVVRGDDYQLALAAWLFNELDNAPTAQGQPRAKHEYRLSNTSDDLVRIYYLSGVDTPQRLQETASKVRSTTGSRRILTYNAPNALAIRGTAEQIAMADRVIGEQ